MKGLLIIIGIVTGLIIASGECSAVTDHSTSVSFHCVDIMYVFARGSGATNSGSGMFYEISTTARRMGAKYGVEINVADLDYPAENLSSIRELFGAYVSAGRAYKFGQSVRIGMENLRLFYQKAHSQCPNMKYGLIGYSQGAMVVSGAAKYFDADATLFLMMLGDPETYLPEGEGLFPSACFGGELSPWRTFAPNCRTSSGVFGARKPYEIEKLKGKYSLWCNRNDYVCGSTRNPFNNSGHVAYDTQGKIGWGIAYLMKKAGYMSSATKMRSASYSDSGQTNDLLFDENTTTFEEVSKVSDDDVVVDEKYSEPSEVAVNFDEDKILLTWEPSTDAGKYLLLRLNGVDLGYIDATVGAFEIRDVDYDIENRLAVAWMDVNGDMGAMREVSTHIISKEKAVSGGGEVPIKPQAVSKSVNAEHVNDNDISDGVAMESIANNAQPLPKSIKTNSERNRLSLANKTDVVNVVVGMVGASGLLLALFMKRRHGN